MLAVESYQSLVIQFYQILWMQIYRLHFFTFTAVSDSMRTPEHHESRETGWELSLTVRNTPIGYYGLSGNTHNTIRKT